MSNAVEGKTVGKKSAAAVKYRDPKTGATWTGHGRAPSWIASAKNRDRFLVDGGTAMAKSASAGNAEAVALGAVARVKPGERIGLDGAITSGRSTIRPSVCVSSYECMTR
jgi:hypothetical protein